MNARNLLLLLVLLFNLVVVPLLYTDQPFDGVDNVARIVFGVPEPQSRAIVTGLYDLTQP